MARLHQKTIVTKKDPLVIVHTHIEVSYTLFVKTPVASAVKRKYEIQARQSSHLAAHHYYIVRDQESSEV